MNANYQSPRIARILKLSSVWIIALLLSAFLSHAAISWLKIRGKPIGYRVFGSSQSAPLAVFYGTSPSFDGLDWALIADHLGGGIENWGLATSSANEWEQLQPGSASVGRTFIVVSAVDLNESNLGDFRAEFVSFPETIRQLRQADADWDFSRRVLNQYPLTYIRKLFPTAGRANGVINGLQMQRRRLLRKSAANGDNQRVSSLEQVDRLTDWDSTRREQNIQMMRAQCNGKQIFGTLKAHALVRLVRRAKERGDVSIIVLPMSPTYQREFLATEVSVELEQTLSAAHAASAGSAMVRLDRLVTLQRDDLFWDLCHLNGDGRKIATAALLKELGK